MLIPGQLIAAVTFPGVIVHEMAHQFFCRITKTAVIDVKYFQFGNPAGYVLHEKPKSAYAHLAIGLGPLLFNSLISAIIAFPAITPTMSFGASNLSDLFLIWIALSIAMHSFPSTGDAKSIWAAVMRPSGNPLLKALTVPIVGFLYIGAIGSIFWLDAIYGLFVIVILPTLLLG